VCERTANVKQIAKANQLIKKLQFAFRSESFENPVLQRHYASIEAMALDRDTVEEISDFTRMSFLLQVICKCISKKLYDKLSIFL